MAAPPAYELMRNHLCRLHGGGLIHKTCLCEELLSTLTAPYKSLSKERKRENIRTYKGSLGNYIAYERETLKRRMQYEYNYPPCNSLAFGGNNARPLEEPRVCAIPRSVF